MTFLHLLGTYPLAVGLLSQIVVFIASLKSGDKAAARQSAILTVALGFITGSLLMRPHSPPALVPDLIALGGAVLLLTPGVQALLKLAKSKAA